MIRWVAKWGESFFFLMNLSRALYSFNHELHIYIYIYCRVLGPRSSLSTCILSLWPKPRTTIYLRMRSLRQKRLWGWIKRLVLAIMAQENGSRMNASLAGQSWGPKGWSINKGNDPGNFVGMDKHCKDVR